MLEQFLQWLAGDLIELRLRCRTEDLELAHEIRDIVRLKTESPAAVSITRDETQDSGFIEATWISNARFWLPITIHNTNYLEKS